MKKQIFYLRKPLADPHLIGTKVPVIEPTEPLILWTVRLYDHILVMPELTILIQNNYCLN